MAERYGLRDVILYVLSQAELGLSKLVYTLFFTQYARLPPSKTLYVLECCSGLLSRAAFTIQDGRVWSASIVNALEEMEGLVEVGDTAPTRLTLTERGRREAEEAERRIPLIVRQMLVNIASEVASMRVGELADAAACILNARPEKLMLYNGWSVERVAEDTGLRVERIDATPFAQLLDQLCSLYAPHLFSPAS